MSCLIVAWSNVLLPRGFISVKGHFMMLYEGNVNLALNKVVQEVEGLYTRHAAMRKWQRARVVGSRSLIRYSIALCRMGVA